MAPRKRKLIADPSAPTGGRRHTGNKAIEVVKGDPSEGQAHLDLPMQRFWERCNIPQLEDALALSTEKRWTELLRVMHHPITRNWSMTRIAKRCGLTLGDLTKFWRDSRMQQAMLITSDALPGVMQNIADDASNRKHACPRCDGYGTLLNDRAGNSNYPQALDDSPQTPVFEGAVGTSLNSEQPLRPCPECRGTGEVTARGDNDARKLLLEVGGVTGKKAPVIMNQHNHFPGSVENFVDKWDKDDGGVMDAEFEDVKEKPE